LFFVVSIAAKSQQFGASEIPASNNKPDFTIEDDQGPSIGIEELFRDFERPGIIVVTSFMNDLSSMIRLIDLSVFFVGKNGFLRYCKMSVKSK